MQPVDWPSSGAIGSLRNGSPPATPATATDAAREFEAYLVGAMLRLGTKPIGGESLLDGGSAGRMYRELFYEEVARLAARQGGFGIADLLRQGVPGLRGEEDAR